MKILLLLFYFSTSAYGSFIGQDIFLDQDEMKPLKSVPLDYQVIVSDFIQKFSGEVLAWGGELKVEFDLKNSRVNAFASRDMGKWKITFLGGLIKHSKMNSEVFTAILCHELGHHIGGAPYKFPDDEVRSWVSVEGQSDYYASNICLKRIFEFQDNQSFLKAIKISPFMKEACEAHTSNESEKYICLRSTYISRELGLFLATLGQGRRGRRGRTPRFDTPDTSQVSSTTIQHPKAQCRLDSYFQGSICEQYYFRLPNEQNCPQRELKYSGSRPLCWYAP